MQLTQSESMCYITSYVFLISFDSLIRDDFIASVHKFL